MKKRALLIAEKKDLMDKIKSVYDKYGHEDIIDFKAFSGHVVRLKEPDEYNEDWKKWDLSYLPIIPEKFEYTPDKLKYKLYKDVYDALKTNKYDYVINGGDPAREGCNIIMAALEVMNCKLPVKRLWNNDLTEGEIRRALNELIDGNVKWHQNMVKASQLRAYFDWGVGMNFSRAMTLKSGKTINVGRVMTPVLKMVVDRELSIQNFKSVDYYELESVFDKYTGMYIYENVEGQEDTKLLNIEEAEKIKKLIEGEGVVREIKKDKVVKRASKLYSLAGLQNDANEVYGYTMSETLEIAQSLYEKKYLSYPRTDSSHLTKSIAAEFKEILNTIRNVNALSKYVENVINNDTVINKISSDKKYVDDKKVSDHYAIIVTKEIPDLSKLTDKERNIYILVAKKLLSIFMPPTVINKTVVITEVNGHRFKSKGSQVEDLGFKKLYTDKIDDVELPEMKEEDVVKVVECNLLSKKTIPPARLNDKTLNSMMENSGRMIESDELKDVMNAAKGIGTPATRAQIVEKLVKLKFIERKNKNFHATKDGIEIIQELKDFDIVSVELTAIWEKRLKEIEIDEYDPDDFYAEMLDYIRKNTEEMKNMKTSIRSGKKVLGSCPVCSSNDVVETAKYYICSDYSKEGGCDFVIPKLLWGAKISESDIKKLILGKETSEMKFKIVKDGKTKEWSSKLIYDKENKKITFGKREASVICKCPKCGSDFVEGGKYYLCSEYKKSCDVIIPKEYLGAKISRDEVRPLLLSKEIKEREFKYSKNGVSKSWKSKLKMDIKEVRLIFPTEEIKPVCKCNCGSDIVERKNYYLCSEYKKSCNVIIPKEYSGAKISTKDVKDLMDGKCTSKKDFAWKSGKTGSARLEYKDRLQYVFD